MAKQSSPYPNEQLQNMKTRPRRFQQSEQQRQARLRRARQQLKDERTLWRYEAMDDLDALSAHNVVLLARHYARQAAP